MPKTRKLAGRRACLLGLGASVAMGACAITNRSRQLNDKAQTIVDEKGDLAVMREVSLREHAAAKNLIYEVHALTEHQFDRCHLMLN